MKYNTKSPIVFFIYKRPDTTQKVFESIKRSQPQKLYIIADGPKDEKEQIITTQTREVVKDVDWECKVIRKYSNKNLGLKDRIISGLNDVFTKEEKAIIIEDDCLANESFYKYCDVLLEKYKDNSKISSISGLGLISNQVQNSIYFSKYVRVWGWATWRRSWNNFKDLQKESREQIRETLIKSLSDPKIIEYWEYVLRKIKEGKINTWDYQWEYAHFKNNSLSVVPRVDLVENIGTGNNDTHNHHQKNIVKNISQMKFPMQYPIEIKTNEDLDKLYEDRIINTSSTKHILSLKVKYKKLINIFK